MNFRALRGGSSVLASSRAASHMWLLSTSKVSQTQTMGVKHKLDLRTLYEKKKNPYFKMLITCPDIKS